MAERGIQLVLDLPVEPRFGAEDFLVSPSNEEAYGLIERWPDWPGQLLLLGGPPGSGKSHLAAIWAARAGATILSVASLSNGTVPELLAGPLVLEDLDKSRPDEASLFHLVNLARERRLPVLFTTANAVETCGIETPDLLSRLRLAPSVWLGPPDDALLRSVLVKLLLDRQLIVDTTVIDFVATRIERSLGRAVKVVALLDREALSRGRRITRAIAAEVLGRFSELTDESS